MQEHEDEYSEEGNNDENLKYLNIFSILFAIKVFEEG